MQFKDYKKDLSLKQRLKDSGLEHIIKIYIHEHFFISVPYLSLSFTLAPYLSKYLTSSNFPDWIALISGVKPLKSVSVMIRYYCIIIQSYIILIKK